MNSERQDGFDESEDEVEDPIEGPGDSIGCMMTRVCTEVQPGDKVLAKEGDLLEDSDEIWSRESIMIFVEQRKKLTRPLQGHCGTHRRFTSRNGFLCSSCRSLFIARLMASPGSA